jgi:hypothetical protein
MQKNLRYGTRNLVSLHLFLLCFGLSGPAFALWLPWAGDGDKAKKTIIDVWDAVAAKDKRVLRELVSGSGASAFIDQEIAAARQFRIKSYECDRINVKIDAVQGKYAFVEYDKRVTEETGQSRSMRMLSVLEKVNGDWKLLINPATTQKLDAKSKEELLKPPIISNNEQADFEPKEKSFKTQNQSTAGKSVPEKNTRTESLQKEVYNSNGVTVSVGPNPVATPEALYSNNQNSGPQGTGLKTMEKTDGQQVSIDHQSKLPQLDESAAKSAAAGSREVYNQNGVTVTVSPPTGNVIR